MIVAEKKMQAYLNEKASLKSVLIFCFSGLITPSQFLRALALCRNEKEWKAFFFDCLLTLISCSAFLSIFFLTLSSWSFFYTPYGFIFVSALFLLSALLMKKIPCCQYVSAILIYALIAILNMTFQTNSFLYQHLFLWFILLIFLNLFHTQTGLRLLTFIVFNTACVFYGVQNVIAFETLSPFSFFFLQITLNFAFFFFLKKKGLSLFSNPQESTLKQAKDKEKNISLKELLACLNISIFDPVSAPCLKTSYKASQKRPKKRIFLAFFLFIASTYLVFCFYPQCLTLFLLTVLFFSTLGIFLPFKGFYGFAFYQTLLLSAFTLLFLQEVQTFFSLNAPHPPPFFLFMGFLLIELFVLFKRLNKDLELSEKLLFLFATLFLILVCHFFSFGISFGLILFALAYFINSESLAKIALGFFLGFFLLFILSIETSFLTLSFWLLGATLLFSCLLLPLKYSLKKEHD